MKTQVHEQFLVKPGKDVKLASYPTSYALPYQDMQTGKQKLRENRKKIETLTDKLYAAGSHALVLIFQSMDAGGKDSTLKHVLRRVRPQITKTLNLQEPSRKELQHDYLWRIYKDLPERGRVGIFNRSHYEEVVTTRVHPGYIVSQNIPGIDSMNKIDGRFWTRRFEQINQFEKHQADNGVHFVKFFLHLSPGVQKKRFLKRIHRPDKHWKFSYKDIEERKHWDAYQKAYQDAISNTSTPWAPWYIIPADHKWYIRAAVSDILVHVMEEMGIKYPAPDEKQKTDMEKARRELERGLQA